MIRVRSAVSMVSAVGLLLAVVVAAWAGSKTCKPNPSDDGAFGGTAPTAEEFATYPKTLPPGAFAARLNLPSPPIRFVIADTDLPHVHEQGTPENQGSPGSCEVWSAGYALGSYTANLTNGNPIKNRKNTVSPGFLYPFVLEQAGETCGGSTKAPDTLNYLVKSKAPSLRTVRYHPSCTYLDSVDTSQSCETDPAFCTDLHIGSWTSLNTLLGSEALDLAKGHNAQSQLVQITIVVPWEFGSYRGGVFAAPSTCPSSTSGSTQTCTQFGPIACVADATTGTGCAQHGVVIVGYDDDKPDPATGVLGALRIMNSFGHKWGEHGFIWMAYSTFEAIYLGSTLAEPPINSSAAGLTVTDAFQWVERPPGEKPRAHMIFQALVGEPLQLGEVLITSPAPDNQTVAQTHGHQFRNGHLYITRHDGQQFQPGLYTLRLQGTTAAGAPVDFTATVPVDLAAGETLSPAALPSGVTGTNGQPVH